jgi:ATP-dependent RNA helicase DDX27
LLTSFLCGVFPVFQRKRDKYEGLSRKQKRSRMAKEEDAAYEESTRAVDASIRSAKKALRPTKITEPEAKPLRQTKPKAAREGPAKKKIRIGKGAFDTEFGKKNEKAVGEGARAGRNDGVGLGGKGKGKAKGKTSAKGGKGGAGAGAKGGKGGGKRR